MTIRDRLSGLSLQSVGCEHTWTECRTIDGKFSHGSPKTNDPSGAPNPSSKELQAGLVFGKAVSIYELCFVHPLKYQVFTDWFSCWNESRGLRQLWLGLDTEGMMSTRFEPSLASQHAILFSRSSSLVTYK